LRKLDKHLKTNTHLKHNKVIGKIELINNGKFVSFYKKIQPNSRQPSNTNNDNEHGKANNGLYTSHLRSGCFFGTTFFHAIKLKITLKDWALDPYCIKSYQN